MLQKLFEISYTYTNSLPKVFHNILYKEVLSLCFDDLVPVVYESWYAIFWQATLFHIAATWISFSLFYRQKILPFHTDDDDQEQTNSDASILEQSGNVKRVSMKWSWMFVCFFSFYKTFCCLNGKYTLVAYRNPCLQVQGLRCIVGDTRTDLCRRFVRWIRTHFKHVGCNWE